MLYVLDFASQLPHDGGAFYSHDTMELSRAHYRGMWPSVLYAASLWLHHGGFNNVSKERAATDVAGSTNLGLGAANASSSKSPEEINTDRFHLIFGEFSLKVYCYTSDNWSCYCGLWPFVNLSYPVSELTC